MPEALQVPSTSESNALVERIVLSSGFQKSPRLRELLEFVAASSLQNPSASLTEQQIGTSVFHRPPQYDSSSDTIVRVQISQLRKRLEHYFLTEGHNERIAVEIPRGSYNAVFTARSVPGPEAPPSSAPQPHATGSPQAAPNRNSQWLIVSLVAIVIVLATACVLLTMRVARPETATVAGPALQTLWSNLVKPNQKTSLVVADSAFGFIQDALGAPMDLDRYLQHDPQQWIDGNRTDPQLARALAMLSFRQYTSIGDILVARRILSVNPALQSQISIVFARNYSARGPASDNVILLGSQRSNPWVQLYLDRVNFVFDYDETARKAIVRNRKPRPGESESYMIAGEGPGIKEGYAVIAFLPNHSGTANVLMMAGTDMEATEGAGVVATSEAELAGVLARMGVKGKLPYFEGLFKTRRLAGAPQECSLLAWRPIAN